jgi:hypothetical protein
LVPGTAVNLLAAISPFRLLHQDPALHQVARNSGDRGARDTQTSCHLGTVHGALADYQVKDMQRVGLSQITEGSAASD